MSRGGLAGWGCTSRSDLRASSWCAVTVSVAQVSFGRGAKHGHRAGGAGPGAGFVLSGHPSHVHAPGQGTLPTVTVGELLAASQRHCASA